MSAKTFFILIISTQLFFIALDFISAHYTRSKSLEKKGNLNFSSFLFLAATIVVYGLIQFGGLAIIPKTETLIGWFKNILPPLHILNLSNENLPMVGWVLIGVITFYISGFWDYIVHRFLSHSKRLFFTHEYHHLPSRLFLALPGLSVRPFVVVAVLPATLGTIFSIIFVLKIFHLEDISLMPLVYWVILIQSIILAVTHSEFFMGQWWMYRTFKYPSITSPQEHEMHHTVDLQGNYGNFTMIWDKIFGTYVDPSKPENQNHILGLAYDQDFLGALTAGKIKLSKKARDKFQIGRYCNLYDKNDKK